MKKIVSEYGELLTVGEVAEMFRVDPKTVNRWAKAGKLSYVRTIGSHHRFRADEVMRLLRETEVHRDDRDA